MEKKYITPSVKVRTIETESIMAASGNEVSPSNPTTGLDNDPKDGGTSTGGTETVTTKFNVWGDDEE